MNDARDNGLKHLWLVGGGKLASSFLEEGLLTHLNITQFPIKLGSGIPLFASHALKELAVKQKEVTRKKGFQKVVIALDV